MNVILNVGLIAGTITAVGGALAVLYAPVRWWKARKPKPPKAGIY